jgi:hypothetical protein
MQRLLMLSLGVALEVPALAYLFMVIAEQIPRTKSWDFSSNRSVSLLGPTEPLRVARVDSDEQYYFQGNIRSSIRLTSDKRWSGSANLVVFEALSGQIRTIDWRGRHASTDRIYVEAKRMLEELGLQQEGLESWYAAVRGGELVSFTIETDGDPRIVLNVRIADSEKPDSAAWSWYVMVYVEWKGQSAEGR